MKKWEYYMYPPINPSVEDLNELGKRGWELVGIGQSPGPYETFYFKRELPEQISEENE